MNNQTLNLKFESLPTQAKNQVIALVESLSKKYGSNKKGKKKNPNFSDSEFIGIWKDRNEFNDSSSWVRSIRKSEWENGFEKLNSD